MAADSGETESSSDEALEALSDVGLWAIHPSQFRSAYGDSEAKLPKCEILAYLFEDDADLAALQGPFALEPARNHACASALQLLQARALLQARRLQKRCALILAERQSLVLRRKKPRAPPSVAPEPTREWLQKKSGAVRSNKFWPTRRARSLAAATSGLTRCEIEQQELVRWRRELVVVLQSAKLPVCEQTRLATHPDAAIAAAIGAARASTIRSRVREWKRAGRYFHAVTAHPWPKHVGVLLDYLRERRLEPCQLAPFPLPF